MIINMYAHYNVSGRRYPVYHPATSDLCDPVQVIIPDSWETYTGGCEELVIVLPDGAKVLDCHIQTQPDGKAYFSGMAGRKWYVTVK